MSTTLDTARRELRLAERELAEVGGQKKAVEEQLVQLRAELQEMGVPEASLDSYVLALEKEIATIELELQQLEGEIQENLKQFTKTS